MIILKLILFLFTVGIPSVLVAIGWKAWQMAKLKNRYEDIIVVGCHPKTGEPPVFPSSADWIEDVAMFVDHRSIAATVAQQKKLLKESGNRFYTDERLTDKQRIDVLGIGFREGEHCNEDWAKDYPKRIIELAGDRRSFRIGRMKADSKKTGSNFYARNHMHQKGNVVEW